MGFRSWLYGDLIEFRRRNNESFNAIAPLRVNVDDLRDFDQRLRELFPQVRVTARSVDQEASTQNRPVGSIDELLGMPLYDRKSIHYAVYSYAPENRPVGSGMERAPIGHIHLNMTSICNVVWMNDDAEQKLREAIKVLADDADRRVAARHLEQALFLSPALMVAGLFAWACINLGSIKTLPLLIVVGLVLVPTGVLVYRAMRTALYFRMNNRDHLILNEKSRLEVNADRQNSRRDRKVGLISGLIIGPIGALLGALITVWVK